MERQKDVLRDFMMGKSTGAFEDGDRGCNHIGEQKGGKSVGNNKMRSESWRCCKFWHCVLCIYCFDLIFCHFFRLVLVFMRT